MQIYIKKKNKEVYVLEENWIQSWFRRTEELYSLQLYRI